MQKLYPILLQTLFVLKQLDFYFSNKYNIEYILFTIS